MSSGECTDDPVDGDQRQQQKIFFNSNSNDSYSIGSRQSQLSSERRLLDQAPRDLRLHNRLGSPIGNLSELDDRGLLEGGASVKNCYSSSSQRRNRRPLEMKKRSSRLLERGKEVTTKMRNSLFHMIRVLHRRGFNIEEYCRMIVSSNIGMMQKNDFSAMLRNIGLPFSTKDLNEIAKQYAVPPKLELVDFESFLSDAGIKTTSCERNGFELDGDIDLTSQRAVNYHARALFDLKEMLIETVESLGQQIDDIYRMFARWDSDCSGSITATQFLRVLMRLHLDLPDQDQDFLVDLLDTTSMGRIEYESLLDFCFAGLAGNSSHSGTASYENRNPQNLTIVADDNAHEGEENRVASQEPSSVRSRSGSRRPHTAAPSSTSRAHSPDGTSHRKGFGFGSEALLGGTQRPTTASARAGPNSEYRICPSDDSNVERECVTRPESAFSDIPNDNDMCLSEGEWGGNLAYLALSKESFPLSNSTYRDSYGAGREMYVDNCDNVGSNCDDGSRSSQCAEKDCGVHLDTASASLNGTEHEALSSSTASRSPAQKDWENLEGTLEIVTDTDSEYKRSGTAEYGSFSGGGGRNAYRGINSSSDTQSHMGNDRDGDHLLHNHSNDHFERSDEGTAEPIGHLRFLASQILSTVRDMVLERKNSGKHLGEIFRHFDRTGKSYFDAKDFINATSDLQIETTERVAALAVAEIALDGIDSVSYGEFQVFILDPAHRAFERAIQQRLAESLERHGRAFQASFHSVFWEEEKDLTGVSSTQDNLTDGNVSIRAFVSSCHKLGLRLTQTDLDRLVRRFDVHGQQRSCAASRFIRMVERSDQWQRAEAALVHQYVAGKEASALRAESSNHHVTTGFRLSDEMINMAERLGIKAISEPQLLWIARDALSVSLPAQWIVLKDSAGKPFYYNRGTNKSRWDHPLDSHFKKLRDQHRVQTSSSRDAGSGTDWEDSEDEYLRTSLGLNLTLHPSQAGSPSKLRAAIERATHTHRSYEDQPVSRTAAAHPLGGSGSGSGCGSEISRPYSAVVDPSPMWVESKLPSVRAKNVRDTTTDHKMSPLFSSTRADPKPRSKSATAGRRPVPGLGPGSGPGSGTNPRLSSPCSMHREKERGRQLNPPIVSYGAGVPHIHSQKQRARPNMSEDNSRVSGGCHTRLSSAGTSRKPFTAGSTNSPIKPRAVDARRIVSNSNSSALLPSRGGSALEDKLAFMFSSDVIHRLDSIVPLSCDNPSTRSSSSNASQIVLPNSLASTMLRTNRQGTGGVVIL